jgi:hypothetical protein
LAWALLPMVVFSGQPTMACRCSSGHIRLFCARSLESGRHLEADGAAARRHKPCSCCAEACVERPFADEACPSCGGSGTWQGAATSPPTCRCTPLLHALFTSPKRSATRLPHTAYARVALHPMVVSDVQTRGIPYPPLTELAARDLTILHCNLRF